MKSICTTGCRPAKFLFILFAVFVAVTLHGQQATLSVQGVLTKADGTAVDDGSYNIEFSLWRSESSTAPADKVYTENIATQTTGGVYSVILGLAQPLTAPFNEPYWLGVKFGATELLPRPRLTSAPFALSLLGQSNTFPSTGTVIADALNVAGAVNAGSVAATGNVSGANLTTAGNVSAANMNASGNVGGATLSASGAINGATVTATDFVTGARMLVPGGAPNPGIGNKGYSFGAGGDPDGGLFSLGEDNVCLYANASKALEANNAGVIIPGYLRTSASYAFINDHDSGMFSPQDGRLQFRVNGQLVAQFDQPTPYTNNETVGSSVRFFGIQKGPNNPEVEWDEVTGQLQVDNSSRKYKRNIQPLMDDFTLILKAEPKLYNRVGYPDDLFEAGYIAEEFDSLGLTRLVHYNRLGEIIGVNYKKISIYLTEIVKDQQQDLTVMKNEMTAMQAELEALRKENESLRASNHEVQAQQAAFGKQLETLTKQMKYLETMANNR